MPPNVPRRPTANNTPVATVDRSCVSRSPHSHGWSQAGRRQWPQPQSLAGAAATDTTAAGRPATLRQTGQAAPACRRWPGSRTLQDPLHVSGTAPSSPAAEGEGGGRAACRAHSSGSEWSGSVASGGVGGPHHTAAVSQAVCLLLVPQPASSVTPKYRPTH